VIFENDSLHGQLVVPVATHSRTLVNPGHKSCGLILSVRQIAVRCGCLGAVELLSDSYALHFLPAPSIILNSVELFAHGGLHCDVHDVDQFVHLVQYTTSVARRFHLHLSIANCRRLARAMTGVRSCAGDWPFEG